MSIRTLTIATCAVLAVAGCGRKEKPQDTVVPSAPSSQEASSPRDLSTAAPIAVNPVSRLPPETLKMYVFDCGRIAISDLDGFSSAGDYKGISDEFTDTCYLIRHPQGDLLWDLGLPAAIQGPEPTVNDVFTLALDETIAQQLSGIGLSPADIDYVSISHSHFDHSGQPEIAQTAIWLVHQNEYRAMFGTPEAAAQYAGFADLDRREFTGDFDVFGDGSVVILEMPGHTPGHTALQLKFPDYGPMLLTGDLYHRTQSRALGRVPRFNSDEAQTRASMARFEQIAEELGAIVVIQHEPDDVGQLPTVPGAVQ